MLVQSPHLPPSLSLINFVPVQSVPATVSIVDAVVTSRRLFEAFKVDKKFEVPS